jgi:cell division topological specificity factor
MKDIFAELYNKVIKFFNKTDEKTENAKDVACNRLKLVLMQDRTNLSPAIMDRMRSELIELLSKYM